MTRGHLPTRVLAARWPRRVGQRLYASETRCFTSLWQRDMFMWAKNIFCPQEPLFWAFEVAIITLYPSVPVLVNFDRIFSRCLRWFFWLNCGPLSLRKITKMIFHRCSCACTKIEPGCDLKILRTGEHAQLSRSLYQKFLKDKLCILSYSRLNTVSEVVDTLQ
jgi:hypothetical protein